MNMERKVRIKGKKPPGMSNQNNNSPDTYPA